MKIKMKKPKERPSPNGPKYWMAMGTLAAYMTFCTKTELLAQAPPTPALT